MTEQPNPAAPPKKPKEPHKPPKPGAEHRAACVAKAPAPTPEQIAVLRSAFAPQMARRGRAA